MKKVVLPIIASLLLICSCHRRPVYPPQLLEADSLCSVQPDSAIALLEELKAESAQWDKATQMYYHLLTVKARDKAFITHTSDSLMLQVLSYYEHGGDKQLLPEAYYYMGSTYRDLNDAPRALEYYQKSLDTMSKNVSVLRRVVTNQMGWLYYRQYLYDKALDYYLQGYRYDSIMGDRVEMASDLVNIGYIYRCKDSLSTSLDYYLQSRNLIEAIGDSAMEVEIATQIAAIYIPMGRYEEAIKTIQLPLRFVNRANINSVYSITAKAYLYSGLVDSASYYFNQLLIVGNLYGKQAANEYLSEIAANEGQIVDASRFMKQFRILTDSIQTITATETVAQMNSLYNYQKALEEKEAIAEKNNTNRWIIFLLCLFLIISILFTWFFYRRIKQRRVAMKDKLEEVEQERETMRIENERDVADLKIQIDDLKNRLISVGKENFQLSSMIATQQETIQLQLQEAEKRLIRNNNLDEQLKSSKLYAHIINLINRKKKRLSRNDFEDLKKLYEEVAPDFMEKLLGLCRYNDIELQVTLLRRMGISPTDIAFLTNYVKSKISNVRSDLFKRVTGEKGKASQWDEFVYNL